MSTTPVSRTVVLLGASVRAAAVSALRGGWAPWCADLFADSDLAARAPAVRVHRYPRGLAAAARRAPSGPWMYTGGLENHPDLVDRIARGRTLLGNAGKVLRHVRDPLRVADALRRSGVACPACADSADGLPADGTWLVKPRKSSGGAGIAPWRGQEIARRGGRYFQRRIEGLRLAAAFVAARGHALLLGVTRQLVGEAWLHAGPFAYCGSIGPLPLSAGLRRQFERIGEALAAEFDLVGLFGVDAVLAGDVVLPVEVNPRYPASAEVLERAGGFSAVGWHVAACAGALPDAPPAAGRRWCGKAVLFAPRDAVVGQALADRWLAAALGDPPALADVPQAGTRLAHGRPVLTVLADDRHPGPVLRRLHTRAAGCQRRLFV